MRFGSLLVVASLSIAVIAEGAYIVHTRRQMSSLSERIEAIAAEQDEAEVMAPRASVGGWSTRGGAPVGGGDDRPSGGQPRLPPPRLVVPPPGSTGQPSLPAMLDNPEAREQLRQFVVASIEQERQAQRQQAEVRFEERQRERTERIAKELNLSPAESEKFTQLTQSAQTARRELGNRVQAGELTREAAGREFAALRQKAEGDLRSLLGDQRMQKYEEMRRGGPGGEGRGGWGGRRGPPGGGPGGPQPQAAAPQ